MDQAKLVEQSSSPSLINSNTTHTTSVAIQNMDESCAVVDTPLVHDTNTTLSNSKDNINEQTITTVDKENYTFVSMWNFDTIVIDVKKQILQFIPFAVYKSSSKARHQIVTFVAFDASFNVPVVCQLNPQIFQMRLISKSWKEVMEETLQKPFHYFIETVKMPISPPPLKYSSKQSSTFSHQLQRLMEVKQIYVKNYKQLYDQNEEARVKSNIKNLIPMVSVWKSMATFIFICLVCFFLLLSIQNILEWSLPQLSTYFHYLSFINIIPLVLLFFSIPFHLFAIALLENYWKPSSPLKWFICFVALVVPMILPLLMNSFIILYVLNTTVLQQYVVNSPTVLGRRELLPWPVVFTPLYILFTILWLGLAGLVLYIMVLSCCINDDRGPSWKSVRQYIFVPLLSFILFSCVFGFIIAISICMEIPQYLNPAYAYLFMIVFQLLLTVICFETVLFEREEHTYMKRIVPINCVLLFVPITFLMNHILACIASFGLILMTVVYLHILLPFGLFYSWIMLRLAGKTYKLFLTASPPPFSQNSIKFVPKDTFPEDIFTNTRVAQLSDSAWHLKTDRK